MTKAPKKTKSDETQKPLSQEAIDLIDHIAEILAEEFVKAMKEQEEKDDESGNLR